MTNTVHVIVQDGHKVKAVFIPYETPELWELGVTAVVVTILVAALVDLFRARGREG